MDVKLYQYVTWHVLVGTTRFNILNTNDEKPTLETWNLWTEFPSCTCSEFGKRVKNNFYYKFLKEKINISKY